MVEFIRCLRSDWLKTRRSALRYLAAFLPVLYGLVMLLYFSLLEPDDMLQLKIYDTFFAAMGIVLPLLIAMFTGLMGEMEERAGNFHAVLASPVSRAKSYMSKVVMLLLTQIFCVFASVSILLLGMKVFLHVDNIAYHMFYVGAALLVAGSLVLLLVHLFLSYNSGLGVTLAVGGAGLLIAAMVGSTSVGDLIWRWVPWAWPIRLPRLVEVFIPSAEFSANISPQYIFTDKISMIISPFFGATIGVLIISLVWFEKWQGRKSFE